MLTVSTNGRGELVQAERICYHLVFLLLHQLDLVLYYLHLPAGASVGGGATPAKLDINSISPYSKSSIAALVPEFVNTTDINTSSVISYTILNYQLQQFSPYNEVFLP